MSPHEGEFSTVFSEGGDAEAVARVGVDVHRVADDVLLAGVKGVTDLMTVPGLINLDFADVQSVMSGTTWRRVMHEGMKRKDSFAGMGVKRGAEVQSPS